MTLSPRIFRATKARASIRIGWSSCGLLIYVLWSYYSWANWWLMAYRDKVFSGTSPGDVPGRDEQVTSKITVSGSDDTYFPITFELIASIRPREDGHRLPIATIDGDLAADAN